MFLFRALGRTLLNRLASADVGLVRLGSAWARSVSTTCLGVDQLLGGVSAGRQRSGGRLGWARATGQPVLGNGLECSGPDMTLVGGHTVAAGSGSPQVMRSPHVIGSSQAVAPAQTKRCRVAEGHTAVVVA